MALFGWSGNLRRIGILASLLYAALLIVATAAVSRPVENLVRDVMMTTISPFTTLPPGIVVVAVTEQTLAKFPYRSPLDRGFLADVVQRIAAAGPRAIGIDLLFDQPTEPGKDARLADAIEAAGVPVVIASGSSVDDLTAKQLQFLNGYAPNARRGLVALSHDRLDGVVREAFPGRETDGAWLPSFATSLAEAAGIQVRRNPDKMVYYRSPDLTPAKLTVYPAHAAALAPPAWFKGQFVLIGVDVPLQDRHATPFAMLNGSDAGALPGVVMHAHELARLIAGDRIVAPALPAGIVPFLVAGVFCLWIAWRPMPVAIKPVLVIGAIIAVLTAEVLSFAWFGVLLPMVAPAMLLLGVSAFVGFLAWQRDSRERRFIQTAFSQYLSPSVVDEIVREPSALRIGGSERLVTCVFTDLEGFTSFSEKASPEVLASVLNRYLDEICALFVTHGATIDKLIGDAVVGFFGAPGVQEDQGKRAVVLALAIDKRSRRLREEMAQAGQDIGSTRIGVHRGPAIVGNFGGNRFFNYTAMGDTVNTAARLEGANKFIGTLNCISDQAAKFAEGCLLRPSGALFLKGKNECTRAFEALEDTEANRAMVGEYLEAYRMMADGEPQAEAAFEALAHKYPSDALIAFHRKRLAKGEVGDDIHLAGK